MWRIDGFGISCGCLFSDITGGVWPPADELYQRKKNFYRLPLRNVDRPFLLFFSLAHIHTPLFKTPAFAGKSRHGRYGDNIEEVDRMIGEYMLARVAKRDLLGSGLRAVDRPDCPSTTQCNI